MGGDHYSRLSIQPWDIIESWYGKEHFIHYLLGNVLKYLSRAGKKQDNTRLMDLQKARHYLDRVIEEEENANTQKQTRHRK